MLGPLFEFECRALFLFLLHLLLDLLQLHAPVLLFDLLLVLRSLLVNLAVLFESFDRFNLCLVLNDISLLLEDVSLSLIFKRDVPSS